MARKISPIASQPDSFRSVVILVRTPDEHSSRRYLQDVRQQIEKALPSGTRWHGPRTADPFAWFNAYNPC